MTMIFSSDVSDVILVQMNPLPEGDTVVLCPPAADLEMFW